MSLNVSKYQDDHRDGYERLVYIFQGGGALGAFQLGAYQALIESGYHPDWICGISIGAINAAIIAGNRHEDRFEKLKEFWNRVSLLSLFAQAYSLYEVPKIHAAFSAQWALICGINSFYLPRTLNPWLISKATPDEISFYDTVPLRKTLLELIDFDYLNEGHIRLSVGAVSVTQGKEVFFDNTKHVLTVDHIMASAALPPGFPAVKIGEEYYWDGGVYSNSPIALVIEECDEQDTLCFMVDLFSAKGVLPHSLDGILEREKDIRYSSRSIRQQSKHNSPYNLRNAIRKLGKKLTPEQLNNPEVQKLLTLGNSHDLHVAHIIYRSPLGTELNSKDYEFSKASIHRRIESGYHHTKSMVQDKRHRWLERSQQHDEVIYKENETESLFLQGE